MKNMSIGRTISVGNRVSLPKEVVELLGIKPGMGVMFEIRDGSIYLHPAEIQAIKMPEE